MPKSKPSRGSGFNFEAWLEAVNKSAHVSILFCSDPCGLPLMPIATQCGSNLEVIGVACPAGHFTMRVLAGVIEDGEFPGEESQSHTVCRR